MGKEFTDLTWEELCDLICGDPEEDGDDDLVILSEINQQTKEVSNGHLSN